ncbi:Cyclic nucleotide-binding protein [Pseudocohnilembus persalinus]|uniref:Cyclic nucleotide-binding protein n=1 Tax=Pseudocohnilembus persalinus TaxID=266149 RepID=A0A0V0QC57_PSEPJ|nr:Cyclic nucleotide-binding protein [Pseudocohnilembus persalinus]|eukprot:KRW99738.1 Cyclic nucleotide-binding protein [Pseudocohnilembus persalinus]
MFVIKTETKNNLDLFSLFFSLVALVHFAACIIYGAAKYEYEILGCQNCWLQDGSMISKNEEWDQQYLTTFYLISALLMGEGVYMIPQTKIEILAYNFLILIAVILVGYYINIMGQIMQIRNYLQYLYIQQSELVTKEEEEVLEKISKNLRDEINSEYYVKIIQNIQLITENFSEKFIDQLLLTIEEIKLSSQEYIHQVSDKDNNLYYIQKGQIELKVKGDQKFNGPIISERNILGEYEFLTGLPRNYSLISKEFSIVYKIDRSKFLALLKNYEEDFQKFKFAQDKCLYSEHINNNNMIIFCCQICGQAGHIFPNCFNCQVKINKYKVIEEENSNKQQTRDPIFSRYLKQKIQSIKNVHLLTQIVQDNLDFFQRIQVIEMQNSLGATSTSSSSSNLTSNQTSNLNSSSQEYTDTSSEMTSYLKEENSENEQTSNQSETLEDIQLEQSGQRPFGAENNNNYNNKNKNQSQSQNSFSSQIEEQDLQTINQDKTSKIQNNNIIQNIQKYQNQPSQLYQNFSEQVIQLGNQQQIYGKLNDKNFSKNKKKNSQNNSPTLQNQQVFLQDDMIQQQNKRKHSYSLSTIKSQSASLEIAQKNQQQSFVSDPQKKKSRKNNITEIMQENLKPPKSFSRKVNQFTKYTNGMSLSSEQLDQEKQLKKQKNSKKHKIKSEKTIQIQSNLDLDAHQQKKQLHDNYLTQKYKKNSLKKKKSSSSKSQSYKKTNLKSCQDFSSNNSVKEKISQKKIRHENFSNQLNQNTDTNTITEPNQFPSLKLIDTSQKDDLLDLQQELSIKYVQSSSKPCFQTYKNNKNKQQKYNYNNIQNNNCKNQNSSKKISLKSFKSETAVNSKESPLNQKSYYSPTIKSRNRSKYQQINKFHKNYHNINSSKSSSITNINIKQIQKLKNQKQLKFCVINNFENSKEKNKIIKNLKKIENFCRSYSENYSSSSSDNYKINEIKVHNKQNSQDENQNKQIKKNIKNREKYNSAQQQNLPIIKLPLQQIEQIPYHDLLDVHGNSIQRNKSQKSAFQEILLRNQHITDINKGSISKQNSQTKSKEHSVSYLSQTKISNNKIQPRKYKFQIQKESSSKQKKIQKSQEIFQIQQLSQNNKNSDNIKENERLNINNSNNRTSKKRLSCLITNKNKRRTSSQLKVLPSNLSLEQSNQTNKISSKPSLNKAINKEIIEFQKNQLETNKKVKNLKKSDPNNVQSQASIDVSISSQKQISKQQQVNSEILNKICNHCNLQVNLGLQTEKRKNYQIYYPQHNFEEMVYHHNQQRQKKINQVLKDIHQKQKTQLNKNQRLNHRNTYINNMYKSYQPNLNISNQLNSNISNNLNTNNNIINNNNYNNNNLSKSIKKNSIEKNSKPQQNEFVNMLATYQPKQMREQSHSENTFAY